MIPLHLGYWGHAAVLRFRVMLLWSPDIVAAPMCMRLCVYGRFLDLPPPPPPGYSDTRFPLFFGGPLS